MASYPAQPRYLLAILQDVQEKEHYISVDVMRSVAAYLNVPESRVYSVATFYKALSLVPLGKNVIKMCDGTACHIRGSPEVLKAFEKELGIKNGETTEDGMFTLQTVNCLGACALAPVVTINDRVFGKVRVKDVPGIIQEVLEDETE
ncbi:NADH-quinone oxidoreductase subunit NuoE [Methanogenium organophilum]|uniref:NADH-quinone oxidoreductase subunit NuoE n=1 Tax=Methanogenium organophilum TaxID=2199 RepID=A0A9X9S6E9_METOG|nr:NADH-quinone oxidoreductase subunit NuoE [Methanogenium organophilum]WAI02583.1 NADH-quinone oxidoreductase subunit NuoE [Methanogenium organophilum]